MPPPPFVWIRHRLWTVANWSDELPDDAWLLLRPASEDELASHAKCVPGSEEEAFWTSVHSDDHRLRSED